MCFADTRQHMADKEKLHDNQLRAAQSAATQAETRLAHQVAEGQRAKAAFTEFTQQLVSLAVLPFSVPSIESPCIHQSV